MIDAGTMSPAVRAAVFIGAVLLEAIVLYVGYGALERAVGQSVIEWIESA